MAPIRYSVKAAPQYAGSRNQLGQPTGIPQSGTRNQLGQPTGVGQSPAPSAVGGFGSAIGRALGPAVRRVGATIDGVPMVRTAQTPNPFAALTEAQQQARARSLVDAQVNPLLAEIRAEYDRRSAAGSAAIRGISEALASRLAGFGASARDIYSQAQQSTAATESALAGFLQGQGGAEASGLSARLAGINAPAATGAAASAAQAAGTGAAGASYGKGSAVLEDLISRGASAQEYAAKLPGIGAALGLQQMGKFQGQLTEDEKTQLGQLTSQIPGLVSSTLGDLRSTELTKAQERERIREYGQTRADRLAAAAADVKAAKAKNAASVQIARLKAKGQTQAAQAKEDALRNRPSPSLSHGSPYLVNAYGELLTNAKGKPLTNTAYRAPATSTKADKRLEPDLALTKAAGSPTVLNGYGQTYTTPGGHTLKYAPPSTSKPTLEQLGTSASMGGWDAKSGALSPAFRAQLASFRGVDISQVPATATRAELEFARILQKQKPTRTLRDASTADEWLMWSDGTKAGRNPNYKKPGVKQPARQAVAIDLSRYAGTWVDRYGDRIEGATGKPPPPPSTTSGQKLDLTRSQAEGRWVNADGTPITGIPGKPPPLRPAPKGSRGQLAKWNGDAETFADNVWQGTDAVEDANGNVKTPAQPPLSFTDALAEARKEPTPYAIMVKALRRRYEHGSKAVQQAVTAPNTSFTLTGKGRLAMLRDGQFVKFMKPGEAGYQIALARAKAGR